MTPENQNDKIKKLALSGDIRSAVLLYRETHNVGLKDATDTIRQIAGLPPIPEKIGQIGLSPATQQRLNTIFRPEEQNGAALLLIRECGDNLPGHYNATPCSLERVRFAALKLSRGNILNLQNAVELAKTDWRDLLVAADFADDPKAHETWMPK